MRYFPCLTIAGSDCNPAQCRGDHDHSQCLQSTSLDDTRSHVTVTGYILHYSVTLVLRLARLSIPGRLAEVSLLECVFVSVCGQKGESRERPPRRPRRSGGRVSFGIRLRIFDIIKPLCVPLLPLF